MTSDRSITGILPKRKKKAEKHRDMLPVETLLIGMGFVSKELDDFKRRAEKLPEITDMPPRFTYKCGAWRALTPNADCPWWTFQRMSGNHVDYMVDIPLDVETDRIRAFLLGDYPENEQQKHLYTISQSRVLTEAADKLLKSVSYNDAGGLEDLSLNAMGELVTALAMYKQALR